MESIDTNVVHVDLHIHLFRFRENGYRCSRGVNASLGFRRGYALHTVYTRFELHFAIHIFSFYFTDNLLISAVCTLGIVHNRRAPAHFFEKALVHPEKIAGKNGRLIAAGTSPDFQDDVAAVVGVLGDEQFFDGLFQLFQSGNQFI